MGASVVKSNEHPDSSPHCVPDVDRERRIGFPEVIYCPGKTDEQLRTVGRALFAAHPNVLATRATPAQAALLRELDARVGYSELGRVVYLHLDRTPRGRGEIAVMSAGTTDIPVAEEAACTAEVMGSVVRRIYDVGVAGIHRVLKRREELEGCEVVIVCAGMEGALPSVVGGLTSRPVIAVPTSIGYGASFQGLAALLGMLNSCAPGVTVVNIDNGFGAAYAACRINRLR
jgi:NCAIR mutase (PurE)-related protein